MNNTKLFILAAVVAFSTSSIALAGRDDAGDRAFDKAVESQVIADGGTTDETTGQQATTTVQPDRAVASDFTNDYLDSIADERANENTVAKKDAAEHDKFLNSLRGVNR